jgi:hypothetical protein
LKNQFERRGSEIAIFLNRSDGTILKTSISANDFEKVNEFSGTWYARWNKGTKSFYVMGNLPTVNGKRGTVYLHRLILEAEPGLVPDHINHDTLNNTRDNLRLLTHAENLQNRTGPQLNCKSGVRGVYWFKPHNKWMAKLRLNGKDIFIGYFKDLEKAKLAIEEARKKLMPYS